MFCSYSFDMQIYLCVDVFVHFDLPKYFCLSEAKQHADQLYWILSISSIIDTFSIIWTLPAMFRQIFPQFHDVCTSEFSEILDIMVHLLHCLIWQFLWRFWFMFVIHSPCIVYINKECVVHYCRHQVAGCVFILLHLACNKMCKTMPSLVLINRLQLGWNRWMYASQHSN